MLQDDILEIYNSLVVFSDSTVTSKFPLPIKVWYDRSYRHIVFEQKGKSVRLGLLLYYCLDLEAIEKPTYLLPEDYDYLMATLQDVINSGKLLNERTTLSVENLGFDIYSVDLAEFDKGPGIIGRARFVSGTSWYFKWKTKRKYRQYGI